MSIPPMSGPNDTFAQASAGGISPLSLARSALARWRSATFLAILLGGVLAAAVYVSFPPEYSTTALLKFRFNDFLTAAEGVGGAVKEDLENQQRTQVAFVRSGLVLDAASKSDPRVYPVAKLAKDLKAGFSEGTPVMYVSLTGLEPEAMAVSVNAVTKAFMELAAEADQRDLFDKAAQLDKAIEGSGQAILKKKGSSKKLLESLTTNPQIKAAEADLQAASIELTRTELEIEKKKGMIDRAKRRLETIKTTQIDNATVEEAIELLPAMIEARSVLSKLESTEAEIRSRFTMSGAGELPVTKASEATRRQREILQKLKADSIPRVEENIRRRTRAELAAAIAKDEDEVASLKLAEESLRKKRESGATVVATSIPVSVEMELKAIEQDEDVLKSMRTKRERLRIELQSGGPKVTIFQVADVPQAPNYRSQLIKTGFAGITGLVVGWLAVGWLETRSRRVRDGRVLAAHTGLRILGAIPSGAPSGSGLLRPDDLGVAVAADLLRTSLQLDDRLRSRRTLVVTSATESEGKSTLAMLLAGSLARAGFRTLLVDGDLRKPSLSERLGVTLRPGLSESLTLTQPNRTRAKPDDIDESGEIEELEGLPLGLIQAGANGQMAAARLARADLRAWFSSLRKHWEYIIIDSPPLLPVPDAAFLGKAADGVVLCARNGISRVEQVHTAMDHLNNLGIDCLGIVLNDVRGGRPNYYGSGRIDPPSLTAPYVVAERSDS